MIQSFADRSSIALDLDLGATASEFGKITCDLKSQHDRTQASLPAGREHPAR
jgi:hypothetical protein